jgi:hypothetical protein
MNDLIPGSSLLEVIKNYVPKIMHDWQNRARAEKKAYRPRNSKELLLARKITTYDELFSFRES